MVHALALLAAGRHPIASIFFVGGVIFFSGSIYAIVLDHDKFGWMAPATPLGGLFLIAGWLALAFGGGTAYQRV